MIYPPNIPFTEVAEYPGTHQWISFDLRISQMTDLFRMFPVSPVVPLLRPQEYARDFRDLLAIRETPFPQHVTCEFFPRW